MNIFYKIDQKILERYPTVWNTKLVWILLICTCIHLLFFIIGFLFYSNPESLQNRYIESNFFDSGLILVNVIVSLLLLVGWLVFMFKNNSFKNFYPNSSLQMFGQFVQYFLIILLSTSFYLSFMFGSETYIKINYPNQKMQQQIELVNKAYPFLAHDPNQYLLSNKQYPEIFNKLYCETNSNKIDFSRKYFSYFDSSFQFNNLYSITVTERDSLNRFIYPIHEAKNNVELAFMNELDTKCIFYFKKNVVDVSEYIKSSNLNYSNFSDVFYLIGSGNNFKTYDDAYYNLYEDEYSAKKIEQKDFNAVKINKDVEELLQKNDKEIFKKLFSDFLNLADSYKIKHNLTSDLWISYVFASPNFDVKHFILDHEPYGNSVDNEISYTDDFVEPVLVTSAEGNTEEDPLITERRSFEKNAITKNYVESKNLRNVFQNIDELKQSSYFADSLPVFLWMAFLLSSLIFSFRVTNLKAVLFSVIFAGLISLTSGFLFVIIGFSFYRASEFVILYYTLILGSVILLIPIFFPHLGSKLFRSILINLSLNGFVFYILLILGIISYHQQKECEALRNNSVEYFPCETILSSLDEKTISYLLLFCGFIFVLFYSNVIKKWKSSPE